MALNVLLVIVGTLTATVLFATLHALLFLRATGGGADATATIRWMVDDIRGDLVNALGDRGVISAGDTFLADFVVVNGQVGLWIFAFGAQYKLVNEAKEELL